VNRTLLKSLPARIGVAIRNGDKVRVQTIEAENKFASYTVLANPDNPLILEVELKAWAYGTEALGVISDDLEISGYSIIAIDHPETEVEGFGSDSGAQ
jgi:hypothetical protein